MLDFPLFAFLAVGVTRPWLRFGPGTALSVLLLVAGIALVLSYVATRVSLRWV